MRHDTPVHEWHPATPVVPRRRRVTGRPELVIVVALLLVVVLVASIAVACAKSQDVRTGTFPPASLPSVPVSALKPVSYWEQRYLESWEDVHRQALPLSTSGDSWDQYTLSYDLDASTAMYRATGRRQYIDRALLYVDNIVATARPSSSISASQYHDGYLGWASKQTDGDPPGQEFPLYESYFWRYATTMLRVIRQAPALYDDPTYRAQYDRLLNFAEVNIFAKWYARGANENIYRSRTHMTAHWATIALNLSLLTGDAGRRARYRTVVDNVDQHLPTAKAGLRGQLRPNPVVKSAYFWNDQWGSFKRPGQDVSHGNAVVAYVVEARDNGGYWTAADTDRLGALLINVIWPRDGVFADFVDGSGTGNGWFSDGFVKLGRYSAAVQQRLDRHTVVNNQFMANMALNAKILS
jgi:hypothetical protein